MKAKDKIISIAEKLGIITTTIDTKRSYVLSFPFKEDELGKISYEIFDDIMHIYFYDYYKPLKIKKKDIIFKKLREAKAKGHC